MFLPLVTKCQRFVSEGATQKGKMRVMCSKKRVNIGVHMGTKVASNIPPCWSECMPSCITKKTKLEELIIQIPVALTKISKAQLAVTKDFWRCKPDFWTLSFLAGFSRVEFQWINYWFFGINASSWDIREILVSRYWLSTSRT